MRLGFALGLLAIGGAIILVNAIVFDERFFPAYPAAGGLASMTLLLVIGSSLVPRYRDRHRLLLTHIAIWLAIALALALGYMAFGPG